MRHRNASKYSIAFQRKVRKITQILEAAGHKTIELVSNSSELESSYFKANYKTKQKERKENKQIKGPSRSNRKSPWLEN